MSVVTAAIQSGVDVNIKDPYDPYKVQEYKATHETVTLILCFECTTRYSTCM